MKFVADENVDAPIIKRLRQEGHSVELISERSIGEDDERVLELSVQAGAVLITADTDFGELVFRQGRASTGVLLIRLSGLSAQAKADVVSAALKSHGEEMPESFSVVSPGAVRIRHRATH